jgi:hypothetical protein
MATLYQKGDTDIIPSRPRIGDVLDFPNVFGKVVSVGKERSTERIYAVELTVSKLIVETEEEGGYFHEGPTTIDVTLVIMTARDYSSCRSWVELLHW